MRNLNPGTDAEEEGPKDTMYLLNRTRSSGKLTMTSKIRVSMREGVHRWQIRSGEG